MQGTKSNRDRKNGASREEWQKRKTEANAERPSQLQITSQDGKITWERA
jgi:hypothetical protein